MAAACLRALVPALLLVALSVPAAATDQVSCAAQCVAGKASVCSPVEFTGGSPRLQVKPLLNLVDINLGCLVGFSSP